jgi:DNA-binding transcriptional MerR regulator|tara:strand:- start:636 stop:839 length:204 start_codon:yes stop_codon:yes gene_type:complete
MEDEQKQEIILYGYRDSLMLYDEGLSIDDIKEVLELYEQRELYLTCAGIKLAIDELIEKYGNDSVRN